MGTEEQVFGLYVPVNYSLFVHEGHAVAELSDDGGGCFFGKAAFWLFFEDFVDFTAWGIFEYQVDTFLVMEEPIQL